MVQGGDGLTDQIHATQILGNFDEANAVFERSAHVFVGDTNLGAVEGIQDAFPVVKDLARDSSILVEYSTGEAIQTLAS